MTNRTLCCFMLSFLLGNLFGKEKSLWFAVIFLLFTTYISINIAHCCKSKAWKIILFRSLAGVFLFCVGAEHFQAEQKKWNTLDTVLKEEKEITVCGKVHRKEEKTEQYLYILTDTHILVENTTYPSYGILIYSSNEQFQLGDTLKATGVYTPFQTPRNEGNFNEKQYYQSKKIGIRLYAKKEVLISKEDNTYTLFLENLRQRFKKTYVKCMSKADSGMMIDMTLGDKSLLEDEQKSLYQKAGISHILAISGLHISLLGMGIFRLLQRLLCPRKASALLAMGMAYSFGIMSGMEISTMRAVLMFVLFMAADFSGYSYDSLTALAISASVQIWENPFVLYYAGFLFSYGAALGVTAAARILKKSKRQAEIEREENCQIEKHLKENKKKGIWRYFIEKWKETIFASICIQLTTIPLSLYFYYEISCYSVIINGCILSFLGVLLVLGIAGAFLGSFYLPAGKLLLTPVSYMLSGNEWLCQKFLSLPYAVLLTGKPDIKLLLIYYAMLVFVLYLLWHGKSRKWFAGILAAFVLLLFWRKGPVFEINVLDVGQGDGIFIQTKEGAHFFIDGGSSDVNQVGKYRILPFLKSRGIRSIKGWIVSHADKDHISGLEELLQEGYPIEYLIVAKGMIKDKASDKLRKLAQNAGCKILFVHPNAPNRKFGTEKLVFTVLHPELSAQTELDRNSMSLVVSLDYQGFTGIFTGDIGKAQEQELIEKEAHHLKNIYFYKGAHHGSDGSNSQEFLNLLSPKVTVISCSEKNSYGHPAKEALERIRNTGSQIFCTKDNGQITIRPEKGNIRILCFQESDSTH